MKNVFKAIAIIYIVISVASVIVYSISVSRLIKIFTEEEPDKIEISDKCVKQELGRQL